MTDGQRASSRLTGRARVLLPATLLLLVALTVHRLFLAAPGVSIVEFDGATMGTTYAVRLATAPLSADRHSEIAAAIDRRLDRVNALMSTYDPDSEVSRFNDHLRTSPFRISEETFSVIEVAQRVADATGGAFDITVAPLVDAWGFGAVDVPPEIPSPGELARIGAHVGHFRIFLDQATGTVAKADPELRIDLSAVAKGYGVDQVASVLEEFGYTDYLVEIGGELRGRGRKQDGSSWSVGVENPDPGGRSLFRTFSLIDEAVATSGDYRNFIEIDGIMYPHIIDPRTSMPVTHAGASVTVIHEDAVVADAWATALSVLGPVDGLRLAERRGLRALFLVRRGSTVEPVSTPQFDERYGPSS